MNIDDLAREAIAGLETSKEGMKEIREKIQSGNHDGILLKAQPNAGTKDIKSEYEGDTWIVFNGPQVKSAIGNMGTFSAGRDHGEYRGYSAACPASHRRRNGVVSIKPR